VGHYLLAAALALALPAAGADVEGSVRVRSSPNEPAGNAQPVVVYLTGFRQPTLPGSPVISQKNKAFLPSLRVIVAGQSVQFTNDDPVVHNVFSTSAARSFDLGKPGPQQTREVTFPTPGLVDVYCNIHEAMFANVLVLPNRAFALVDETGHFVIHDVPPGHYPLHAWGRNIEPFEMEVTATEGKPAALDLVLSPRVFNPTHLDKFGRPYRARPGYVAQ
jgi:plastocyanin